MSDEPMLVLGIPNFSNYAITSDGKSIISILTGNTMKQRLRPNGYLEVSIKDDDGIQRSAGVHRLVASAFIQDTRLHGKIRFVVNHIDGIKTNNDRRNLEWVTYKENSEHAGMLGLTDKCKPISVRDCVTGEVKKYPSFIEAAKDQGVSKDTIAWRFQIEDESRVYPEMKQYRLGHGDQPWKGQDNEPVDTPISGNRKRILVKCLKTNFITRFELISDFALRYNISPALCTKWLKLEGQPVLPGLIQVKLETDQTPWRKVIDPNSEMISFGQRKRVLVTDAFTGIVEEFESATDCAKKLGILTTTLNFRLKTEGRQVFSDNKSYMYIR
jgi:hypothetical protein